MHDKPGRPFTSKLLGAKMESNYRSQLIRDGAASLERWLSGTVILASCNERGTTNSSGEARHDLVIWLHVYYKLGLVTNQEPDTIPTDHSRDVGSYQNDCRVPHQHKPLGPIARLTRMVMCREDVKTGSHAEQRTFVKVFAA